MIPILYDCEQYDCWVDSLPVMVEWLKFLACVYSLVAVGATVWIVW
jgi:hypothetical protein